MDKAFLKTCSIPELLKLQYDLREYPEDKQHWLDVMQEIKERKSSLNKLKEAITKDRVYQCRLCGKRIEMRKDDNCQHDFLLVVLADEKESVK